MVELLAFEARSRKVSLAVEVPRAFPALSADPDQLKQVLVNLTLNAIHACAAGGHVWLRAVAPGREGRATIEVVDDGAGIPDELRHRVFDPFFTTKPLHLAAGLGLTGAQQVVQAHRGAIGIESVVGRGTTVHVLLPATDAPVAGVAATAAPQAGAGRTILIVDDEPIVRNSLRRALTRMGYTVLEAGDGPSAMVAVQTAQPPVDLVILDLVLPGGGAAIFELLTAVRPGLKVLVSSGYSPDTEAAQGLASRATGFLPKPYEMQELREAVAKALAS